MMVQRLAPVVVVFGLVGGLLGASEALGQGSVPVAASEVQQSLASELQPSLDVLRQAVNGVQLEKWKASNGLKDDTDANLGSIRRDLDATLPGLVAAADARPGSVVEMLPVVRNVNALYDVVLRVTERAKMVAPLAQGSALDQGLKRLEDARKALNERVQGAAEGQAQQLRTLNDTVAALKAAPPPAPVATPVTATPAKHPKAKTAVKAKAAPSN